METSSMARSGAVSFPRWGKRCHLRRNRRSRADANETIYHHGFVSGQTITDDPVAVDPGTDADRLEIDDVVLTDNIDHAPALIAADGFIRQEDALVGVRGANRNAAEQARCQQHVLVVEHRADT